MAFPLSPIPGPGFNLNAMKITAKQANEIAEKIYQEARESAKERGESSPHFIIGYLQSKIARILFNPDYAIRSYTDKPLEP